MSLNLPEEMANSGDESSSLGIDNVCLHIDKYLDDLEKTMDIGNSSIRRSSSFGFPCTSMSDDKNWSTASKQSVRRYSLDNDLNKKESNWKNTSSLDESETDINKSLRLCWRNLSYSVEDKLWSTSKCPTICGKHLRKLVLDRQSGEICSGQLTAIIGPSGAGKSTLLESLAGRRKKGLKGEVLVVYEDDYFVNDSVIKVSFIGQKDEVIKVLTVRETLYFASRIKNYNRIKNNYYHERLVRSVLKELNLDICAETRVSQISGGQLKRLSFAVELISGPDILMLDEPTSGLDSSSAFQCILLLRKLADLKHKELNSKAPAIICSIHQPSARVLNIFHQVYVLSFDGRCIYSGPPSQLIDYLSKLGLQCPQFHNPADFIIEIASSDYGAEAVTKLAIAECNRQVDYLNEEKMLLSCNKFLITANGSNAKNCLRVPVAKVIARLKNQSFPHFKHTRLLLRRTYISTIRDPKLTWFRITQAIFIAMLMSYLYDYPIGKADGCLPLRTSDQSAFEKTAATQDNISFIFFVILFTVMASMMPTVLTFPSEVSILIQERNNGWYSCWVYYWTKVIADSPYQIFITIMFCSIIYPMTSQIESYIRFTLFNVIMILVASIAQCVGMLFGTLYVKSVENAVFMAPLSMAPMFLLSGFFGKISAIPVVMKPIAYGSYVKYAFESLLVVLYGMNRCPNFDAIQINGSNAQLPTNVNNVRQNIQNSRQIRVNEQYAQSFPKIWSGYYNPLTYPLNHSTIHDTTRAVNSTSTSLILRHFEVKDETLIENVCILVFILILLRFVTYFILLMKSNKKK